MEQKTQLTWNEFIDWYHEAAYQHYLENHDDDDGIFPPVDFREFTSEDGDLEEFYIRYNSQDMDLVEGWENIKMNQYELAKKGEAWELTM